MSETSKNLLYLLPDVAYIVELVKGKDSDALQISDYLQINGSFMNENEILEESVKKLVGRIKPKEYDLILPDFLFTNTVITVEEKGEEKILAHVEKEVIPGLDISEDTHELHSFVLTEFKGQAKVQLAALEKTVLKPLQNAFSKEKDLSIKQVAPLSWTTKSLISLEPSISIIQMGVNLYLAQHYIGVDQANTAEVEDAAKLVETIKTLKGAEPSIQTVYLLANALVEEKLNEGLKGILPVQQLAKESEDSEMPSYVKQVIEAAIKTMSVSDYKVPLFAFNSADKATDKVIVKDDSKESEEKEDTVKKSTDAVPTEETKTEAALPTPKEIGVEDTDTKDDKAEDSVEDKKDDEEKTEDKEVEKPELEEKKEDSKEKEEATDSAETKKEPEKKEDDNKAKDEPAKESKEESKSEDKSAVETAIDLSQFASTKSEEKKDSKKEEKVTDSTETKLEDVKTSELPKDKNMAEAKTKKVIKNDSGVNSMVKMVFIALVSFFVTVGIGLGIGLGFLTFTNKQTAEEAPAEVVAEASPSPEPTAEPTANTIDRTEYTVLVVNATTKAGYAGEIATVLEEAGFEDVAAKNAKGDYEDENVALMESEDTDLITTLGGDLDFSIKYLEEKDVEDPTGEYDVVVVLVE